MIDLEAIKKQMSPRDKRIMKIIKTGNLGIWVALPPMLFLLAMHLIGGGDWSEEPIFTTRMFYIVPFMMFMGYWNGLFVQWAVKFWSKL